MCCVIGGLRDPQIPVVPLQCERSAMGQGIERERGRQRGRAAAEQRLVRSKTPHLLHPDIHPVVIAMFLKRLQPLAFRKMSFLVFILTSALSVTCLPADTDKGRRKVVHVLEDDTGAVIVQTAPGKVVTHRGGSITLPCRYHHEPENTDPARIRIKWTKVTDALQFEDVFVALGREQRVFGSYKGRVFLEQAGPGDASVIIQNVTLEDYGRFECEVTNDMEDDTGFVNLDLEGVVFPYYPREGRYKLNYHQGEDACKQQDAILASHSQLHKAWLEGLDWCNAGWLEDGSVQYPISHPRDQCGRKDTPAGVRTMATGKVYFLKRFKKVNYAEAVKACIREGSAVAKWVNCTLRGSSSSWTAVRPAGWRTAAAVTPLSTLALAVEDPSPGVRHLGFPDKKFRLYGVFCFQKNKDETAGGTVVTKRPTDSLTKKKSSSSMATMLQGGIKLQRLRAEGGSNFRFDSNKLSPSRKLSIAYKVKHQSDKMHLQK
ncbi:hypothetical protein KUCAC02_022561 [Chaenocephalus aceratus]|uniref:Uncharacterized protein n=1 Tax=Chaenocephalus aceratus TaxID=36190 RepID=A0ACB9XNJ0_CHAAC|nr:hypothetical protein KUCAC02_022561 [Chaenocephalus aceratus]